MNILLLGNGFDLYYQLPTKYHNFLNTVEFLLNNYDDSDIKTIGDVFKSEALQQNDDFIRNSYQKYQDAYDTVELDEFKIKELLKLMRDNVWFKYLVKSFNKDVGWIDFEKEISVVVDSFRKYFRVAGIEFDVSSEELGVTERYIIEELGFFLREREEARISYSGRVIYQKRKVFQKYILEYPLGSKNYVLNKEKIIEELIMKLEDLAKALQIYLSCFVEAVFDKIGFEIKECRALFGTTHTVTLNYTNTYEKFFNDENVFHVHGVTSDKIVLGINPDKYDEMGFVDISFIVFKKYFQRIMYETDFEYSKWIEELEYKKNEGEYCRLTVMGHSLDITDEDIIRTLFSSADEIVVLYHNAKAKSDYITNLVKIYGKQEFDKLRSKQKLAFRSVDDDFEWRVNKIISESSTEQLVKDYL